MEEKGFGEVYATINESQSEILKKISLVVPKQANLDHLMADVIQTS